MFFGVEGHADVLRLEERAAAGVVAGEEDVVAADALFAAGGKVEGDAVVHHEGVVGLVDAFAESVHQYGFSPAVAEFVGGEDLPDAVLVGFAEVGLVAHLVEIDVAVGFDALELAGGHDLARLGGEDVVGEELALVGDDAVDDDDLLCHLTHVRDAGILLRLLHHYHDGFLHRPLLFLLRVQRERQEEC